jgi:potassium/hydrogen antiporter
MLGIELPGSALETVLLAISLLLIASVLASRLSSLLGVPALLVFLAIGMLAGSDGPGGIEYDNYPLSFALGSIALAFIIFDGGLRTSWHRVRPFMGIGISLASIAVLATALLTALFVRYALGRPWTDALLVGAIVSSTDAAAVFGILKARSLALRGTLRRILEFEAAANDPMAVLLTVAVLAYATSAAPGAGSLAALVLAQAGLGFALGWLAGKAIVWVINRVGIEHEGLYSVLLFGFVILLFSATAGAGGSGFLAAYVGGLVVGNSELLHRASLLRFHDGIAWIAQISLFVMLGLLVFPSHLPPMWLDGLLLALFLMFVARPLSVLISAPGRVFSWRERLFVSWVGLRGAAPIILATLPWTVGFPDAEYFFNLVFFVVLVSVLAQGTTITWLARRLGIVEPLAEEQEALAGMLPEGFVPVEIRVRESAPAENRRLFELGLPSGVLLVSVERAGRFLVPAGNTRFAAHDRIRAFARESSLPALRKAFGEVKPHH